MTPDPKPEDLGTGDEDKVDDGTEEAVSDEEHGDPEVAKSLADFRPDYKPGDPVPQGTPKYLIFEETTGRFFVGDRPG